ncbi:PilZ domain-containing protein [Erythrobacter sp. JK5]|uniref:PilZ domain-containing protein n=1 Tax=Erythrobacter sp. JK5 TaxID=2829500 RepID=UPI001BA85257|nr:PilZ domain-containing protein [Erythrobacter sp. JK5]QUL38093.1 PilZ domain-containing protein [Erythrobacter sp. JK5]
MRGSLASRIGRPLDSIGRRQAARLRLAMPGKLVTIYETRRCIVLDLSQTGARIAVDRPLVRGEAGILQCAGIDCFADVVRSEDGGNALAFEEWLLPEQVLAIRDYAEHFDEHQRREFRRTARDWISGGG